MSPRQPQRRHEVFLIAQRGLSCCDKNSLEVAEVSGVSRLRHDLEEGAGGQGAVEAMATHGVLGHRAGWQDRGTRTNLVTLHQPLG